MTTTAAPPSTRRVDAWNRALTAHPGALDLTIRRDRVDGEIPHALRGGRLYANGPGWNVIGGVNLHPFDGHGYVRSFSFESDGSVALRARFVDTATYRDERRARHLIDRGLGTNPSDSWWKNMRRGRARNVANTTLVRWRDRLIAGWEGGLPHALDPESLATRGEETFDGSIRGQVTLAHMKHEARTGRLITCSIRVGRKTRLTFREIDGADELRATHEAELPGLAFVHDFALTPDWCIVGGNPIRLRVGAFARSLLGTSTLIRAVATDKRATPAMHLVSRKGRGLRTVRLPDAGWIVHFGNAFQVGETVVVDACVLPDFEFGEEFGYTGPSTPFDPSKPEARGRQTFYRVTIPSSGDARWEPLTRHGVDFPRFHPAHEGLETPVVFGATRADVRFSDPFDSVIRIDLVDRSRPDSLWSVSEEQFVGEPIFVPKPDDPADGWVLTIVTRPLDGRSELVVLDARDLARGPLATVPMPLLPLAFHGEWASGPSVSAG